MATQYKLIVQENVTAATSTRALLASAANTVVASVTGTDTGGAANVEVLVKKASGSIIELAYQAITTTTPTELLTAPVALEANDALYVRTSRTGTNFVVSYVEDTESVAGQTIDVLSNVDTTGVVDGNALVYDSASGDWIPGAGGGGSSTLDGLTDTNIIAPANGDVLAYNFATGKWMVDGALQDFKSILKSSGGGGLYYDTLNDLTKGYVNLRTDGVDVKKNNTGMELSENSPGIIDFNVQDDGVTPAEITAMRVTNDTGQANAPQVVIGGTVADGTNTLTVIGDADFDSNVQVDGDLTVSGTLNATVSTQNISDIVTTSPSSGQRLEYNGTNWVNVNDAAAFSRVSVSGQSNVIADDNKDTLNIAAGDGITITTNATTDTVTISRDQTDTYLHDQTTGATTWSVAHNLNNERPIVQCYDATGEMIIPQTITITDANNLSVVFAASQTGKARVAGGDLAGDNFPQIVFVNNKSDFPAPVSNVITLQDNYTYFITGEVDLTGDRLVGGQNTTIIGGSSENCKIKSTGLGVGVALFTTEWTTPIRHITFEGVDTAIDINGVTNDPVALDWTGVNFKDVPNVGTINTCDNWIYSKGAFLNSKGLVFDGSVGTIGIDNSIFVGDGAAGSLIEVASTATVTRRFRTIYSSVVAFGSTTGIDVNASATVPVEGFILDNINFSGGSTYLPGVGTADNKSRFFSCKGIDNTAVNGQMYMQGNSTATTISASNTFYKVAGTTTASTDNAKFSHASNRLTCDATVPRKFMMTAHLSFTAGNNQDIEFGFYDSTTGGVRTPSRTVTTTDGGGAAQNVGFSCVTTLEDADYIEIHCSNNTSTTNVTVTNMNILITEI